MKIVAISDTHGLHEELTFPKGEMLIHAGDISMSGTFAETEQFLSWFHKQDYKYKIFIAGNHDLFFERQPEAQIKAALPPNVIYLKDEAVEIEGVKFWGSPVTPWFMNWAFNKRRGEEIARHWELIPQDTDVLITHGPMYRRLDENKEQQHLGCKDLLLKAQKLRLHSHIFGHIHESYGMLDKQKTRFLNASVVNDQYELANAPLVFDIASNL